ncbi:unnamed protein product, partial [Polarella glacialis]
MQLLAPHGAFAYRRHQLRRDTEEVGQSQGGGVLRSLPPEEQVYRQGGEVRDESVTKAEVFHKWHQADRYPAKLHRMIVFVGPSKTFIVTLSDFAEYDGTSCFNLVKGYVQTYYDFPGKAPLVRVMEGNPELDLKLTDDLQEKLTAGLAFQCCFIQAFNYALMYGRWLLSREIFDLLGCASPTVVTAIET